MTTVRTVQCVKLKKERQGYSYKHPKTGFVTFVNPVGAQAEVPADVLHHHDRVVHDSADRDRQRPER